MSESGKRVKPKVNIVPSNSSVKLVLNVFKLVGKKKKKKEALNFLVTGNLE